MDDYERLKANQQAMDRLWYIYDEMRFDLQRKDGKNIKSFEKLRELMAIMESLFKGYVESTPRFFEIIAQEDTIIKNDSTVEIKTNVSGINYNDGEREFVFYGSIPSDGYLTLSSNLTADGLKFYVTNTVPKEVEEKYDVAGYHYCDPTTTRYFAPGEYMIKKGQVIGLGIKHYLSTNISERTRDEMSLWPDWKKRAAGCNYQPSNGDSRTLGP